MYEVVVFAGTTEGYEICRFLAEKKIPAYACVATEYGSRSLTEGEYLKVGSKRLTQEEMAQLFKETSPRMVLDATHPYAAEVTANIKSACRQAGVTYQRVLREEGNHADSAVYVEDTEAAIEYLKETKGNILLTTGSKELQKYTVLPDFEERIYARVLSLPSVMEACKSYGFEGRHLIGMQGPFSMELNAAMLRQYDCRYLVTKDTGKAGGFQEKIDAAHLCGAVPVIIGRPLKEEGMSVPECKKMLSGQFGFELKSHVTLVGIGMGSSSTLTLAGEKAVREADLIIGAKRMADAVRQPHQPVLYEYNSEIIGEYIRNHPEYEKIVVALSGDVGFYSGAKRLGDLLGENVEMICGISSVAYFMSRIGLSWDDARLVSAHGRKCNLISDIRCSQKVFAILGTKDGVAKLAQKLVYYGMGDVLLYVGENLSYEAERIFVKRAEELTEYVGDALSVVCAYNERAVTCNATHGIPDNAFIRGKAPMTKEEVRTVSLAKLRLAPDSVCFDVGAGTGSVSVEMALRASEGMVYAIEKKEEAVGLLEENKRKFAVDNLAIIKGEAPGAMEELPAPTHAFIGGSSGNLRKIVSLLLDKNASVRIVINCITLETVAEALQVIQEYSFEETEIVQLGAARSKNVGRYHMMTGENPIYIITCSGGKGR